MLLKLYPYPIQRGVWKLKRMRARWYTRAANERLRVVFVDLGNVKSDEANIVLLFLLYPVGTSLEFVIRFSRFHRSTPKSSLTPGE